MTDNNVEKTKEQMEDEFIRRFEAIYCEITVLNQDIAEIKAEVKDKGLDAGLLAKVGKARADCKVHKLEEEFEKLLELIRRH